MPEGTEPVQPVSGQGQPDQKAAAQAPTVEELQKIIGQQVTGAVKRHLMDAFKSDEFVGSLRSAMKDMVAQAETERSKKPPTDHEKLQAQIQTLEQMVQKESSAREKAETESRKQKIESGVSNLLNSLDGTGGKPAIKASARVDLTKLLLNGNNLPSAPDVDEQGTVIVRNADGTTRPLAEILGNGYFGEGHYAVERMAFRGSGPHGVTGGTPVASLTVSGKPLKEMYGTTAGNQALAAALQTANGDPAKILAIMQEAQRAVIGG